jgi:hypothetical protein
VGSTIDDKVVREFRNSGCKIYLWFILELVSHGDALSAYHLAISGLAMY